MNRFLHVEFENLVKKTYFKINKLPIIWLKFDLYLKYKHREKLR